jgi:branched-chain amino acid transport system ATP-binding protein
MGDRLLDGVGLTGLGHVQSSNMPTGLARMVELARALAIGPKLLLLDEPGSGLDEAESKALGDLLVGLAAGGMAVLLVEHDMELVMGICDHIYVLDFGDIIASGTPDAIRTNPTVQAAYLGEVAPDTDPSREVESDADPAGPSSVGTGAEGGAER